MSSSIFPRLVVVVAAVIVCVMSCFSDTVTVLAQPSPESTLTIAAEPAVSPYSPTTASNPALSPDILPLFPTPVSGSSPDSAMPVIPSSPSPPNPDDSLTNPDPVLGMAPHGAIPGSSAFGPNPCYSFSMLVLVLVWFAVW